MHANAISRGRTFLLLLPLLPLLTACGSDDKVSARDGANGPSSSSTGTSVDLADASTLGDLSALDAGQLRQVDDASTSDEGGGTLCDPDAPFNAPVLVDGIPGSVDKSYLRLSPDSLTAYFDSNDSFYTATRSSITSAFSSPVTLTVDGSGFGLSPSVTGDGLILYFYNYGIDRLPDALAVATRTTIDGNFVAPTLFNFPPPIPDTPFVREDGNVLYYVQTGQIVRAEMSQDGIQSSRIVSELPGSLSDAPTVTPDDLVIYYASSLDNVIQVASRASESDTFGDLRAPDELNTGGYDAQVPTFITRDRCSLYLSRSHAGTWKYYVARKGK